VSRREEEEKQIGKIRATILSKISLLFQQPLLVAENSIRKCKIISENREDNQLDIEIKKIENSMMQLNDILASIAALANLTEGLLPISKRKYQIWDLFDECQQNLKEALSGHIFKVTVEDDIPPVPFDFNLIQLLLINLISNSIYYSPLQSTIELKARFSEGFIEIAILDEGKKIFEGQNEDIFEQFYQPSDPSFRGVGLGMTLAKPIAAAHHGLLKAQNRPTNGIIFSLYLPIED
jgi:two-component system sensor histidine kinase KdpD